MHTYALYLNADAYGDLEPDDTATALLDWLEENATDFRVCCEVTFRKTRRWGIPLAVKPAFAMFNDTLSTVWWIEIASDVEAVLFKLRWGELVDGRVERLP